MKITRYVHATVSIETKKNKILIDPGKYAFDGGRFNVGKLKPEYFNDIDILVLTHTHADHYDPEVVSVINQKSNPKIISNFEVGEDLTKRGIDHIVMKEGDKKIINNIEFTAYLCDHIIPSIGLTIDDGKNKAYYVSDSIYKEPDTNADILLVPIGNRGLVMSPKEAALFTQKMKPKIVIPIHYESPKDNTTPEDFIREMKTIQSDVIIKIMNYKESINYNT